VTSLSKCVSCTQPPFSGFLYVSSSLDPRRCSPLLACCFPSTCRAAGLGPCGAVSLSVEQCVQWSASSIRSKVSETMLQMFVPREHSCAFCCLYEPVGVQVFVLRLRRSSACLVDPTYPVHIAVRWFASLHLFHHAASGSQQFRAGGGLQRQSLSSTGLHEGRCVDCYWRRDGRREMYSFSGSVSLCPVCKGLDICE
jgi:hypothetical protein